MKSNTEVVSEKVVFEGQWLRMKFIDYKIGEKVFPNYEMVERTTRKKGQEFDGVDIIPIIRTTNKPDQIVIIASFRAPVNKYVLEFPAGLMDSTDLKENALRELKEETGYIGKEFISSDECPPLYGDPWKSPEAEKTVTVIIDGDDPRNQNPKQNLEETEDIRVYLIDLKSDNIKKDLLDLSHQNGYLIESKVYMLFEGLAFAKTVKI